MTDVTIDLSNYKDRVGSRVAPGRYRVVVEDAEESKSSAGNTMITTSLRIVDGGEFDGATIIDRLTLTEKALFRVVGFMQALGIPTPKKRLRINLQRFIGQQLEIEVDDGEPYNGRVKSEVRSYYKIPKGASQQDASDLDDLEDLDPAGESEPAASLAERVAAARSPEDSFDGSVDLDSIDI